MTGSERRDDHGGGGNDRPGLLILFRDERRESHSPGDDPRSSGTRSEPDDEPEPEVASRK